MTKRKILHKRFRSAQILNQVQHRVSQHDGLGIGCLGVGCLGVWVTENRYAAIRCEVLDAQYLPSGLKRVARFIKLVDTVNMEFLTASVFLFNEEAKFEA